MTNDFFTNIPDYSGIGIYALINNRTGKMYIGASQNIHQRIMQHKYHPLRAIKYFFSKNLIGTFPDTVR